MRSIVRKAAGFQRKAMMQLSENHVQKVYYLSCLLLGAEKAAAAQTVRIFEDIWKDPKLKSIESKEGFSQYIVDRTIRQSMQAISDHDSDAYTITADMDFSVKLDTAKIDSMEAFDSFLLGQFSSLQRLVFTMHTVCKYSKQQMSAILGTDLRALNRLLETEENNVKRIIRASGNTQEQSYSKTAVRFIHHEKDCIVPAAVQKQIQKEINRLALPGEERMEKAYRILVRIAVILFVACIIVACFTFGRNKTQKTVNQTTITEETQAATTEETIPATESVEEEDNLYSAQIEIQDYGTITVELDSTSAPVTVENFVTLAQSGFYDGLTFHRIIEGFMMQGGDPEGDGTGGSARTIVGEFSVNGYDNPLSHTRGAIAMARSQSYDSASSQFFIVHQDSPHLDGQYAVFGYVTEGMDIVDAICESAEPIDGNGSIAKGKQPVIKSITITVQENVNNHKEVSE